MDENVMVLVVPFVVQILATTVLLIGRVEEPS